MVEFYQLVQEISWVQDSVMPMQTWTRIPMGSAMKPICPPSPLMGGHNISNGFDVTEQTRVCGRIGNYQCSKGNNSESMQSRVTVPALSIYSNSA